MNYQKIESELEKLFIEYHDPEDFLNDIKNCSYREEKYFCYKKTDKYCLGQTEIELPVYEINICDILSGKKKYLILCDEKNITTFCKIKKNKFCREKKVGIFEKIYPHKIDFFIDDKFCCTNGDLQIYEIIKNISEQIFEKKIMMTLYNFISSNRKTFFIEKNEIDNGFKNISKIIKYKKI